MSYDYSTPGGRYSVHVSPLLPGPAIEIVTRGGTTAVPATETPLLALAALTEPYSLGELPDVEDPDIIEARNALQRYADRKSKQAAQDAEDAKAREFRVVALESDGVWPGSISEWDLMGEAKKDIWRKRYRAARKFFEEQS